MTWRCMWTPPGSPFPEWHDFRYQSAAEVLADIKRGLGAHEVAVVPLEGAKTGRSDDFGGSGACVRTSETKRGAERRTEGEA